MTRTSISGKLCGYCLQTVLLQMTLSTMNVLVCPAQSVDLHSVDKLHYSVGCWPHQFGYPSFNWLFWPNSCNHELQIDSDNLLLNLFAHLFPVTVAISGIRRLIVGTVHSDKSSWPPSHICFWTKHVTVFKIFVQDNPIVTCWVMIQLVHVHLRAVCRDPVRPMLRSEQLLLWRGGT